MLQQAAGIAAAGVGMLGWARSVATSWVGPKIIDGSCRMPSTSQKPQQMIDRCLEYLFVVGLSVDPY